MSVPSSDFIQWAVPLSVLTASLLGSPHCALMCGPLAFAFSSRKTWIYYQLGRGMTYGLAGAVAGALGSRTIAPASGHWISAVSLLAITAILVSGGFRSFFGHTKHFKSLKSLNSITTGLFKASQLARMPAKVKALIAGTLTVFLPCAHLYGALIGAVATGSAGAGTLFMLVFWMGTLPALAIGMKALRHLILPEPGHQTRWAGLILLCAGLLSLAAFATKLQISDNGNQQAPHSCHGPNP